MVKRLIDQQSLDLGDEALADLFRAAAPFEADPFRKRRVLVSMSRVQARGGARFWVRPVVVAMLLVSGTATAALGHRYVTHGTGLFGFGPPAASAAANVKATAPAVHAAAAAPTVDTSKPDETPAPADTVTPDTVDTRANPGRAATRARAHTDSSEDATHVVEAIQALRTEGDPSKAQGLLSDYLKTHPHGVLSEDALALSIEAASAQHDPRAADYARRYLAKFPHGKYRDLASRAIAQQH